MSIHADSPRRVAVETPRGTVQSGPVVDTRTVTNSDRLVEELLVDLGPMRLWVPREETTT